MQARAGVCEMARRGGMLVRRNILRPLSPPPELSRGRFFIVATVLAFAATVPLSANLHVPAPLRLAVYQTKPFAVVGALLLLGVAAALSGRLWAVARNPQWRRIAKWSVAFPAYFAVTAIAKGTHGIEVIALYSLWVAMAFFLVPAALSSEVDLRWMGAVVFACSALQVGAAIAAHYAAGQPPPLLPGRQSYGFVNPHFFAQILEAAVIGLGFWITASAASKWRWLAGVGVFVVALVLAQEAQSRNVLVSLLGLALFYAVLRLGRRWIIAAAPYILAVVMISGAAILGATEFEAEALDRISSSRLSIWSRAIYRAQLDVPAMLWGPTTLPSESDLAPSYDEMRADKEYSKLHTDNFYLDLFLDGGALGIFLFLAPYWLVLCHGWRLLGEPATRRIGAWSMAVLLAVAVQGLFYTTIPTFGSMLGVAIVLLGTGSLSLRADRVARTPAQPHIREEEVPARCW